MEKEKTIFSIIFLEDGLLEACNLINKEKISAKMIKKNKKYIFFPKLIWAVFFIPKKNLSKFLQKKYLYQNKDQAFIRFWLC